MSLLDELRNILTHHHNHAAAQTNQGTTRLIEGHLARLNAVAGDAEHGAAEAHRVLGELYGALNAPTAPVEAAAPVEPVVPEAPVVLAEPAVVVDEPLPEPTVHHDAAPVDVPADIAEVAHAAVEEASVPEAEPTHVEDTA